MGSHALNRAVFLDRDGVLTRASVRDGKPYPPRSVAELEILPECAAALAALKQAGFLLLIVTNQPDIARGIETADDVEAIHAVLRAKLPVDDVRVCPHDDRDACPCRKPRPGLLLAAAQDHAIDLTRSFLIGDRWRDIAAGRHAGCATVWIDRGYTEPRPDPPADVRVESLAEATAWILAGH